MNSCKVNGQQHCVCDITSVYIVSWGKHIIKWYHNESQGSLLIAWDINHTKSTSAHIDSLVPRLLGGGGKKEPGTHCLRMRLIKPRGHTNCVNV